MARCIIMVGNNMVVALSRWKARERAHLGQDKRAGGMKILGGLHAEK